MELVNSIKQPWTFRRPTAADIPFIYATWLRSYRTDSAIGLSARSSIYFQYYHQVLDSILDAQSTQVKIATTAENSYTILGYAVFQPEVLHYIFVKEAFQRNGMAQSFLESERHHLKFYTHRTRTARSLLSHLTYLEYNPFLLYDRTFLGDNHAPESA